MEQQVWSIQLARQSTLRPRVAATTKSDGMWLFLPKEWTKDKARLDKAGVPNASRAYRTRHQLALELLAKNGVMSQILLRRS